MYLAILLVTKSLYCYLVIVGAEAAVAILSNRVRHISIQTRFMVDDDTWPPKQPKNFTPLLLIHHQDDYSPEQVTTMAELMYSGDLDKIALVTDQLPVQHANFSGNDKFQKVLATSKATKKIVEILAPLEEGKQSCFILIEGAPGIGKSVLLKEIHCKWANKQLLQNYQFVLLFCL